MSRTPGFVIPTSFPTTEMLMEKLNELNKKAGFTPLSEEFLHSSMGEKPSLESLVHSGVMGMKWGVRKSNPGGISRGTNRAAKKDAQEFARAKMFYGQGAGTRRKLIKATVEGKSAKDPSYKKAFDQHLSNQDMSKHASKAQGERARKSAVSSTAKTARGVSHMLRGNSQYASAAAAMLFGGAMFAHKQGIDKVVLNAGKTAVNKVKNRPRSGMDAKEWLKNMGINID